MYDCLELDVKPSLKSTPKLLRVNKNQRLNFDPYRKQNALQLRAAPHTGPQSLLRAFTAARSLNFNTQNLPNGSLLLLGLNCEEALLFQRRFPDLLCTYEPARHPPQGYSCPV